MAGCHEGSGETCRQDLKFAGTGAYSVLGQAHFREGWGCQRIIGPASFRQDSRKTLMEGVRAHTCVVVVGDRRCHRRAARRCQAARLCPRHVESEDDETVRGRRFVWTLGQRATVAMNGFRVANGSPPCMQHKRNATTNNDTGTSAPTWLGGIGGPSLELEPVALLDRTSGCVPLYPRMAQCSGTIDTSAASEASMPATCRARRSLEARCPSIMTFTPACSSPLQHAASHSRLHLHIIFSFWPCLPL